MKISDMPTNDELLAEQLKDPDFRKEWERTALARAVALRLVRYRAERNLSQSALAELLDMKQPQVARLERGAVNPELDTLLRLAGALDIEITIDVRPINRKASLVTRRAQNEALASYETAQAVALVAVA